MRIANFAILYFFYSNHGGAILSKSFVTCIINLSALPAASFSASSLNSAILSATSLYISLFEIAR